MHVPAATVVTVAPDTAHTAGVPELNVTASPDVAVADTVKRTFTGWLASGPKVMLCGVGGGGLGMTRNDCWMLAAAAQSAFPPCAATIVQTPAVTVMTSA